VNLEWLMLSDILAYAVLAVLALVAVGFALLPLCLLSGAFAWLRAGRLQREVSELEQAISPR